MEDKLMQSRLGGSRIMEKMGELERRLKIREKEETRRNVVIREMEGERRKAVEEILEVVRVKVEIEEIRKIGEDKGKREILLVRLENEEQKWEVMEKMKKLRGRIERISKDLSWKKRRVRWKLGEIVKMEEATERKFGWKWDEEGEMLRDEKGTVREEIQEEER